MIALVTGASSGIGAEFCRALDSEGADEFWLVSRDEGRLEAVASGLGTRARLFPLDLSSPEGVDSLIRALESERPEVGFLVNCAGLGRFGDTWEVPREDTRSMVSVNVGALVDVTSACVPLMRPGSAIIEVCSASAYLPLKELNVYSASKAFVRSFCDGLRQELEGTGVSVLEVSPGWVETGFIGKSRTSSVPDAVFKHTVTKEQVVSQAMRDLAGGKRRSVCGWYNRFQVFACRHMPRVATYVWKRSLK